MPSLTDLIASAASQVKSNTQNSVSSVKSSAAGSLSTATRSVAGIVPGIVGNATNAVTSGAQQAISTGLKSVTGAASQAISGDFSGALATLSSGPSDVIGSLSKSFGLNSGSTLSNPGASNIDPGNSLAGALARADPMLSFCWYAIMPDVTPIGGSLSPAAPWYYVEEATIPFRTFGAPISIFRNGRNKHYPGPYNVDDLRLTLYADSNNVSASYLLAWNGALLLPTTSSNGDLQGGGYGRPTDYKKSIFVYMLDTAKKQLIKLEYVECWPAQVDPWTLESAAATRLQYHVSFSVGDVYTTIYNTAGSIFDGTAGLSNFQALATNLGTQAISSASSFLT